MHIETLYLVLAYNLVSILSSTFFMPFVVDLLYSPELLHPYLLAFLFSQHQTGPFGLEWDLNVITSHHITSHCTWRL